MAGIETSQGGISRKILVEEKFFAISGSQSENLVRDAVAQATGVELRQLAPGMWAGSKPTDSSYVRMEVTARTLPTDDGTTVQVRIEHKVSGTGLALWITALVVLSVILIPLFWLIARAHKQEEINAQERLVAMHRVWREITDAIGAPRRASYRDAPQRVYVPESAQRRERQEAEALQAEQEAAEQAEQDSLSRS